jgi:uncharacterized membrane protein YebE (DUF533 family)
MGTLAKVAIGVVVAKGVGSMIRKSAGGQSGTGGTFGGPNSPGGGAGGLEDMMGEILGGAKKPSAGSSPDGGVLGGAGGGIGGLLEELGSYGGSQGGTAPRGGIGGTGGTGSIDDILGGLTGGSSGGGSLGDLLGGLTGGKAGSGGLGDLLGGILGGALGGAAGGSTGRGGSFGDVLNQSLGNRGEPDVQPTPEQDAAAALMLRAMIQAAKSDGKIDAVEQKKLLGNLGEVSDAERRFVEAEMRAKIDVQGLARQVPQGLGPQVYTMSVMAIDLDNRNEAQYLHQLATALGIDQRQVNHIHARLGVPALYS